ncbi:hypothetical protein FACS189441_2840 [Betaproteobacteria bacterium]|nr:hypothetical protein FACS189441_2840 [Betaproteobacteria bacterium]
MPSNRVKTWERRRPRRRVWLRAKNLKTAGEDAGAPSFYPINIQLPPDLCWHKNTIFSQLVEYHHYM